MLAHGHPGLYPDRMRTFALRAAFAAAAAIAFASPTTAQTPSRYADQVQAIADEINATTAEPLALRVLDDVAMEGNATTLLLMLSAASAGASPGHIKTSPDYLRASPDGSHQVASTRKKF